MKGKILSTAVAVFRDERVNYLSELKISLFLTAQQSVLASNVSP